MRRGDTFIDQVNATPVTFGILIIYVAMAFLTDPFDPTVAQLLEYGAAPGLLIQDGEPWRLVSHAFLHGGIVHLGFNSYGLVLFGPVLERQMGTWRFILLYLVAAVGGCMTAVLMNFEHVPLVGGSGGLFGMLGAILAYNVRGGRTLLDFMENHGSMRLLVIIGVNLVLGFMIAFVSNSAHIGGLVCGFVLVFCFLQPDRRRQPDATGRLIQIGWAALFASVLLYMFFPVLRYDYNLKSYLRSQDPVWKAEIGLYLQAGESWIFEDYEEEEPKTGFVGVALRESALGPTYRRAIRRWKRGE